MTKTLFKDFLKGFLLLSLVLSAFFGLNPDSNKVYAQETSTISVTEIDFFYSDTCPHCQDEKKFFENVLLPKYPDLVINKYNIADPETAPILHEFTKKHGAEKYTGLVPLTFIRESFIVGYNTDETTGATIEEALQNYMSGNIAETEVCEDEGTELCVIDISDTGSNGIDSGSYTIINQVSKLSAFGLNAEDFSLPILSIVLGFFDGFNVCSLGALILILSLVLTLKSRRRVFIYGGIFLVVTGITYAALIFIWVSVFQLLSPFVVALQTIIGLIGLLGGIYFLRQYLRFRKYGPMCEMNDSPWIQKVTKRIQAVFARENSFWIIGGAVVLFSFVVTVIEFPCSAVIPAAFAAILAESGIGFVGQMLYLGLFILFYLLDEIIIFLIGVWTLRIWTGGTNMTKNLALVQAIVFIILGAFYIGRLLV
jgi:thiol-disulfide isomerase/thioredoxin